MTEPPADNGRFTGLVQALIDAPEQATAQIHASLEDFERRAIAEADGANVANAALFQVGAVAFLLFDAKGDRLAMEAPSWVPAATSFAGLQATATRHSGDGRLMSLVTADGRLLHILWAPLDETSQWNLPAPVRRLATGRAARVMLVAGGAHDEGLLENAVRAFGLTPLEQRAVLAVVRTGSARAAAALLGLAYITVRQALVQAARRMGQPNMPAVVRTIVAAAFGVFPEDADGASLLSDMLQLTPRQAQIALLIASGASREQAARAVGASLVVVKKELEFVYANLGLASAAELSRFIVEVQALRVFARATDGAPGFLDPAIEPSRFLVRANGRERIGWSDYGPISGRPVLIVHSNWACRPVPRELVLALQQRGWRPIAIDRPGFGATHLGRSCAEDPFSQAVDDTLQIMDLLRIDRIPVIARAGAHFVHMFKALAPGRVGPVILVSPTLPTEASQRRHGIMGAMKEAFQSPRLIELFFRIVCAQLTPARIEQLTRAVVRGTPADEALCEDPQFLRDRFRAVRPFASGNMYGGIYEQRIISQGGFDFPPISVFDWVILQGDADNHNSFEDVVRHWGSLLPGTPVIRVPGGGRFLTSSHAMLIATQLQSMSQ